MSPKVDPRRVEENLKDLIIEASKALGLLTACRDSETSCVELVKKHAHYAYNAAWRLNQIVDSLEADDLAG